MVKAALALRSVRQWCREPVYRFDPEPLRTPHCRHARKGRSTHSRLPPPGLRAGAADEEAMMEILYPRCAGLDIHRDSIVACVRLADSRIERHVESFGTTTTELERLSAWLSSYQVTHVAMEATGVYWKPVWAVLVEDFELLLANARHVKTVPGRKTDVNDAVWLADLLAHGLIRPASSRRPRCRRCATSPARASSSPASGRPTSSESQSPWPPSARVRAKGLVRRPGCVSVGVLVPGGKRRSRACAPASHRSTAWRRLTSTCRVAGLRCRNPAPSEPDVTISRHPAQASAACHPIRAWCP